MWEPQHNANLNGGRKMIGECWQRMKVMNAEFERSETGGRLRSCEPGDEQVRDEQALSRMDDEGCPNDLQKPDPRQDGIGMEVEGPSRM